MTKTQILTLYEHERGDFKKPISASTALELNKAVDSLAKHTKFNVLERVLNNRNEVVGLKAAQFVGVVRVDNSLTIEIIPKMYRHDDDSERDSKSVNINNLFFMLDYCGYLYLPHSNASRLSTTKGNFFETLIYIFASDLLKCIQNSAHHEYISVEENLPYLRGKLIINRHITKNSIDQSKFYTQNDLFNPDNNLNRILKYVSRMLLSSTRNQRNKNLLTQIISIFDEVSDRKVTLQMADQTVLTRLNNRFSQSLKMAKLFLASHSVQLASGKYDSFTFLIDMNELFEEFVAKALKKAVRRHQLSDLTIKTQGPSKHLVERTSFSDRGIHSMRPDISILKGMSIDSIIDTKYKIPKKDNHLSVDQADLYQMYAYANKYNTRNITLLYPEKPDVSKIYENYFIDDSCEIKIRSIDLGFRMHKGNISQIEERALELIL